jgi:hypothetical protein
MIKQFARASKAPANGIFVINGLPPGDFLTVLP